MSTEMYVTVALAIFVILVGAFGFLFKNSVFNKIDALFMGQQATHNLITGLKADLPLTYVLKTDCSEKNKTNEGAHKDLRIEMRDIEKKINGRRK